jgi:hypothetical protein
MEGDSGEGDSGGPPVALVAGLGIAAAQVALAVWLALRAPFAGEDAWAFWGLKARMFAAGGPPPGYFHDPSYLDSHPDYPLNVPLAEAAIFRLQGGWGEPLAALFGPVCLAALLLLFAHGLTRLYGTRIAGLATAALALVPALPRYAGDAAADLPLAMYLGLASLYLLLWWRLQRPRDALVMGLLAGGAVWTKKEGAAVAAVIVLAYLAGELLRRRAALSARLRYLAWGCLAAPVLALPWEIFLHTVHPPGTDFLPVTPAVLLAHLYRLPSIGAEFVLQMLSAGNWSLLWGMLAATLLLTARRLSPHGYGLCAVLLGQLGVYAMAYVFSSWSLYLVHIWTSLDRLLLQAAPLAVLVLVETAQTLIVPQRSSLAREQPVAERVPVH